MSRITRRFWAVVGLAAMVWAAPGCSGPSAEQAAGGGRWVCPMHPTYVSDHKGSCPICGMDLVPAVELQAAGTGADGEVEMQLSPEGIALAGVRTSPALKEHLTAKIRAVGVVRPDETRLASVQTRVAGWVESLAVNAVGQQVAAGEPLLTIYSPELVAAQEDLLRALAAREAAAAGTGRSTADLLVSGARRRLALFGVADRFVSDLEARGTALRAVPLAAPAGGTVIERMVMVGMRVEAGMPLLTLADLGTVWIEARFYEDEVGALAAGRTVAVTSPFDPALSLPGRIDFVYPTVDAASRTLAARIVLPNKGGELRPGMYATVTLDIDRGEGILVPDDAILDTGFRRLVFVALGDGRFVPREVTVGARSGGKAMVLAGLGEGEQVVVAANFLLDSESRLRAAIGAGQAGEPAATHDGAHR